MDIKPNWAHENSFKSISNANNSPRKLYAIIVLTKNILSIGHVYNNLQNSCKKYVRVYYT